MKYVECVHESGTVPVTKGKRYEVILFGNEWIRIINDDGMMRLQVMYVLF